MSEITNKIRKLLALASSPNLNEAALAAAEAQRLMLKYGIEQADFDDPTVDVLLVERPEAKSTWFRALAKPVTEACFCEAWFHSGTDRITVVGRKEDVVACSVLLEYLAHEILRLSEAGWIVLRPKGSPVTWKNSFRIAAASTVGRRLKEDRSKALLEEQGRSSTALVRVEKYEMTVKKNIAAWKNKNGVKTTTHSTSYRNDTDGTNAGRRAGEALNLRPPTRALKGRS